MLLNSHDASFSLPHEVQRRIAAAMNADPNRVQWCFRHVGSEAWTPDPALSGFNGIDGPDISAALERVRREYPGAWASGDSVYAFSDDGKRCYRFAFRRPNPRKEKYPFAFSEEQDE